VFRYNTRTADLCGFTRPIVSTKKEYTLEIYAFFPNARPPLTNVGDYYLYVQTGRIVFGRQRTASYDLVGVFDTSWRNFNTANDQYGKGLSLVHVNFYPDGASQYRLLVNSAQQGRYSQTITSGTPVNLGGTVRFFDRYVSDGYPNNPINTDFLFVALYETTITPEQSVERANNPWQLFQPQPARFILIPSSGSVGNYQLTSSLTSTSSTSSSALQVLRALQASLTSSSSTASITLDTAALISLLSAITSASSTSTSAAAIQRTILTALTSASSTPSSALNIQRALSSTVTSTSETATITLSIAGLIALLTAISSTSSTSTASASVQRALASALTSSSSTASITLNTTTLIALLSAVTSGSLTATSALNIARSLSSAINSISSTPSIVLPVQRSLIASHTSQSSTSISALELVNLIALASAINSQSSTSTVTANLVRALVSNLLSASSTSTISLPVLREFASTLVSTSLTDSIDLSLAMLGQVDLVSVIESRSLTNPQVRLLADLVAAIQTEMKLHMVGVAPSFTMTGSGPSIAVHRT